MQRENNSDGQAPCPALRVHPGCLNPCPPSAPTCPALLRGLWLCPSSPSVSQASHPAPAVVPCSTYDALDSLTVAMTSPSPPCPQGTKGLLGEARAAANSCMCSHALDPSPAMLDPAGLTQHIWLPLLWASGFLLLLAVWATQRCRCGVSSKWHQVGGRLLGSPSQGDWPAAGPLLRRRVPGLGGIGAGRDPGAARVRARPRSLSQRSCAHRSLPAADGAGGG